MKDLVCIAAILCGFFSFAQEENTAQIEPIRITSQRQSSPATKHAISSKVDKKVGYMDVLETRTIIRERSNKPQRTVISEPKSVKNAQQDDITRSGTRTITLERQTNPSDIKKASTTKTDQKQ